MEVKPNMCKLSPWIKKMFLSVKFPFRKKPVAIRYVRKSTDTDEISERLIEGILSAVNELDSWTRSKQIKRGIQKKASQKARVNQRKMMICVLTGNIHQRKQR